MPPRPHLALPSPGTPRAIVVGAGSFGTAVAVLLARGGFRTTLQTRTREQCQRLEADRENRDLPARRHAPARPAHRARRQRPRPLRLRLPRRPLGLARRRHRRPLRARAGPPHAGRSRSPRGSCRRTGSRPTVLLTRAASAPRASPASAAPRTRSEMVTDGAGLVAASVDARLAATISDVFTARRRDLRAVERPGRRRAGRRRQERRRARRRRDPGPGPQRRRRRRRPHLPRGLALRRAAGRAARVDDRPRRHGRPRRHRARAAEPQPPGRRAARRGRPGRRRSPAASGRRSRRSTSCRCSPTRSRAPRSRRR